MRSAGTCPDYSARYGTLRPHEKGKHLDLDTTYFFYTTCPRCAKHYGKNYVVGVAKVR